LSLFWGGGGVSIEKGPVWKYARHFRKRRKPECTVKYVFLYVNEFKT